MAEAISDMQTNPQWKISEQSVVYGNFPQNLSSGKGTKKLTALMARGIGSNGLPAFGSRLSRCRLGAMPASLHFISKLSVFYIECSNPLLAPIS